ncbi:MAG: nucleotidyltransferase domain-containing protein [Microcoleus vaginatus WJT46-NPBG5]|nr:nucleotidyltransferase domain-containing protein [Microcoleus vaginatus WJT46-NPBG5]
MRAVILETIIAALQPIDWVLALWQGGSAAHGYTDEWSDIDIAVIVEDNRVQDTFDILEQSLKTISDIQFKWRVPEPAWHGHSQCFYQLEGTSPFLQIDFAVLKRSSRNDFLEVERHGNVVVEFDKANLVTTPTFNKIKHLQEMQVRLAILKNNFDFLQIFVKKELNRGNLVAAISNYNSHTLNPLVEVLGMVYRPNRYDFETKYFNRDFPLEVIARVEQLYCVMNLADLAKKQQEAEVLFAETVKKAEAGFPLGL